MSRLQRLAPVVGLFVLAPFVGEFLLGNLTLAQFPIGTLLAPLYGGGAVLVREIARRRGGGWPMMALLACAYALIEEGTLDQLLWNPAYAGVDSFHTSTYVPMLGTSVELVQTVVALHAVWSICIPIALVETFVPGRRTTPWLGVTGLLTVSIVFVLGAAFVFWGNYAEYRFLAPAHQQVLIGTAVVGLVVAAFSVRSRTPTGDGGRAPSPWILGTAALVTTSAYWMASGLSTAGWGEWIGVALWSLIVAVIVPMVLRWSRSPDWGSRHRFSLAAGATLTYVWLAFPVVPAGGGSVVVDLMSNAVFGAAAVVVLLLASRAAARSDRALMAEQR
ncbi:hypothetical protein [Mycolicibacterium arenosum]|uniref:DUF998 domain-containing protein n=1 Tax=Mycolicibacterium arenosum TaxID=2952157 RepID=A0ABT1LWA5_9MYCO|nr:hypothetical protein [Mycolicibacterium sp. CAU 1645]MCP9271171.1 hypothetical protein [Mycolicibacterium sp. CAU 1645]